MSYTYDITHLFHLHVIVLAQLLQVWKFFWI